MIDGFVISIEPATYADIGGIRTTHETEEAAVNSLSSAMDRRHIEHEIFHDGCNFVFVSTDSTPLAAITPA